MTYYYQQKGNPETIGMKRQGEICCISQNGDCRLLMQRNFIKHTTKF